MKKKPHPFYPLIVFCEDARTRWIERSRTFDAKHNPAKLHILYGRQLGKLQAHKMKPLMELPYTISDLTCAAWPDCAAENEYHKHERPYYNYLNRQNKKPAQVDALAIVDAELEA